MEYAVVIPTLNGGTTWSNAARAIAGQIPEPPTVMVIDSGSDDDTASIALDCGFDLVQIERSEFDHGRTRQWAAQQFPGKDFLVYLTQDAVLLHDDALASLLAAFADDQVAAAYGRQVPGPGASGFESHARRFNYPDESVTKSRDSIPVLGIKAAFCSNSFAAYRTCSLQEVGGFPDRTIFAEDMLVAARLIVAGYRVAYRADAVCEHWHNYTIAQEFRRAFDIGVFHNRERWILETFGAAGGEGASLIFRGLKDIASNNVLELPGAVGRYAAKTLGYSLGRMESVLPHGLKPKLSLNRQFWMKYG